MDEKINIEEFKIKWKDFLASNSYGDLSKEIRSLLSRIKELEEGIERHKAARHNIRPYIFCESDRKLYKLLEEKR